MKSFHETTEENIYTTTNIYTCMKLNPPITLPYVFGSTDQFRTLYYRWLDVQKKLNAVDGKNRSRKIGTFIKTKEWKRAYHTWRIQQLRSFIDEVTQMVGYDPSGDPAIQGILRTIKRSEEAIK